MASGGGGGHPSHLPIIPPITTHPASQPGGGGGGVGSLQTPDASSLFVSSLGGTRGSGIGASANFAPSPVDHSQSFTSLEELLNVTGINSLELDISNGTKQSGGHDGVDSLQRIAKEVESRGSSAAGGSGGMSEPPSKRIHLDTSSSSSLSTLKTTTAVATTTSPSNTRINSPTPPPLPTFASSLPQTTFPSTIQSMAPIASLLDKKDFTSAITTLPKAPPNPQSMFSSSSASLLPSLPPPPPYNFSENPANGSATTTQHKPFPKASQADLAMGHSVDASKPSTLLHPSSSAVANRPQLTGAGSTNTTNKVADSINSNSRSVVLQLMQLYKQYQSLNDQQGMKRVRDQLNMLVSAQQKILAAQNSLAKSAERTVGEVALSTASGAAISQSQSQTGGARMMGVASSGPVPVSQQQQQQHQQRAHQILGQLAGLAGAQSQTSNVLGWQGVGGGGSTVTTNHIPSSGTADWPSNSSSGSMVGKGEAPPSLPPPPAYSNASVTTPSVVNTPPSLLSHMGGGVSTSTSSNNALETQSGTQRTVKQIRMLMDALPDSKRPKNVQELKEFVLQKYSSLFGKGMGSGGGVGSGAIGSSSSSISPGSANFFSSNASSTAPSTSDSFGARAQHQPSLASVSQSASANVAEHFRNSLFAVSSSSSTSQTSLPTIPRIGASELPLPTSRLLPPVFVPPSSSTTVGSSLSLPPAALGGGGGGEAGKPLPPSQQPLQHGSGGTVHAPVTSQFSKAPNAVSMSQSSGRQNPVAPPPAPTTTTPSFSSSSSSSSTGIQAGIPTPLPPGLTLETLGVLCRLPESELQKLKLPPALLSAIKVWKARQVPGNKAKVSSAAATKGNIPVLIPPPPSETASTAGFAHHASAVSHGSSSGGGGSVGGFGKPAVTAATTGSTPAAMPPPPHHLKNHSLGQPNVIPSGAGFPPRSLHAYIPSGAAGLGVPATPRYQSAGTSTSSPSSNSQHLTRYKLKVEQQKIKNERFQALQKALQSSEEARIAFRFSAHLEKMHTQLTNPDTVNAFRSQNDVLARLLPYHLYAEPEPPPAAVEKADAVFESVAQVLLSRSRGLKSRFEQTMMKIDSEGGGESRDMQMQLERLFIEGEQERIQKEKQEKKEAEQIAADLSLMVDHVGAFDSEFSFGDVFNPLMSVDSGIT